MTWKFHMDDSTEIMYDIILRKDILIEVGLNLNF